MRIFSRMILRHMFCQFFLELRAEATSSACIRSVEGVHQMMSVEFPRVSGKETALQALQIVLGPLTWRFRQIIVDKVTRIGSLLVRIR